MVGRRKVVKHMSLDPDLVEALEEAAGREPLSSFVNRTLRKAMGMSEA